MRDKNSFGWLLVTAYYNSNRCSEITSHCIHSSNASTLGHYVTITCAISWSTEATRNALLCCYFFVVLTHIHRLDNGSRDKDEWMSQWSSHWIHKKHCWPSVKWWSGTLKLERRKYFLSVVYNLMTWTILSCWGSMLSQVHTQHVL